MSKKAINMMSRTVKQINVEDVGLYAHDDECFELYIYCAKKYKKKGEIAYHKRAYRCSITDKYLQKLMLEIQDKYLGSAQPVTDESEEEDDD